MSVCLRFRPAVVAAGLVALAACGGGSPAISDGAARSLQADVQAVRQSAESFDPAGVETALAELRTSVAQLKADGQIDDERAAEILAAAADVEALVDEVPTTTTAPPPVVEDDHKGKGRGKGGDD